jgi:hypothetical protein
VWTKSLSKLPDSLSPEAWDRLDSLAVGEYDMLLPSYFAHPSVLLPELGWVGFDPTNNLLCSERHIRVAVGRDYADVPRRAGSLKARPKVN